MLIEVNELKKLINSLNDQQRSLFDDLVEREVSRDAYKERYHVFITGDAGTGKSFLTTVLMEAFKTLNVKSGKELNKPTILAVAPTANAAFIIGGQTIEAALGLSGTNYKYSKLPAERESDLKFKYDEVTTLFLDELSMVGSGKLTKINFRLQDLADGKDKNKFLGNRSSCGAGDFWQLPPVKDKYICFNNSLDSRPQVAPSHWDENYSIYYLTEKMRSKGDAEFGEVCDRIGRGTITEDDEKYLKNLVRQSPNENDNELFKSGEICIIVTTNLKREKINEEKLTNLLPNERVYSNESVDKCTNQPNADPPPENLSYSQTRGLPRKLLLKVGAPIIITVNDQKYKDDGVCNGTRGYIDSFQMEEDNADVIKIIWVVFSDPKVGNRMRVEKQELKGSHVTKDARAVPIQKSKAQFEINHGNHKYTRSQFPLILGYAIRAHKAQGATLKEVVIDFTPDVVDNKTKNPFIIEGSFYVAITRCKNSEHVYLKDFDSSYIKVKKGIAEKVEDMRKTRPYKMYKVFNKAEVFQNSNSEMKIGYLNINGLLDADHYQSLNNDRNLLNLDLLVIAETKLMPQTKTEDLQELIGNYNVIQRFDANDGKKHMGLLMISPKTSSYTKFDTSLLKGFVNEDCQGFVFRIQQIYKKVAFIYIRPGKATEHLIQNLIEYYDCENCDLIMGDLNLNPRIINDRMRLRQLCQNEKLDILLKESTTRNYNQLDHVLGDITLRGNVFATSFFNFYSNHNSIVARIGSDDNALTKPIYQKLNECLRQEYDYEEKEDFANAPTHSPYNYEYKYPNKNKKRKPKKLK